jgi:Tol biopolymer transport system component
MEAKNRRPGNAIATALSLALIMASVLIVATPSSAVTSTTRRISVSSAEAQADGQSYALLDSAISANGRYVVFQSRATNLVAGDTNSVGDTFIRDRTAGTTRRVSVNSAGGQANGVSGVAAVSASGRYVAFTSEATNLVGNDTNGVQDIFIRDRKMGITRRVSVNSNELEGNGASFDPAVSADGRFVAFTSTSFNLVAGDTNGAQDVFIRDRKVGITRRVSVNSGGTQGNADSHVPSISGDGSSVAFMSSATNLVPGDTNAISDTFVRDRATGRTRRVSVSSSEVQGDGFSGDPKISTDGKVVAYDSLATNLVNGDTNATWDVFVRILATGLTRRVSLSSAEGQGDAYSADPSISANGRYVAFYSDAANLVGLDTNGFGDVFVRDRLDRKTRRVSLTAGGSELNDLAYDGSISADGRFVCFNSRATNLVNGDTNALEDVFIRGPLF